MSDTASGTERAGVRGGRRGAIAIVAFAVGFPSLLFLLALLQGSFPVAFNAGIRLLVAAGLGVGLLRGHGWARVVLAVLLAIGAVLGVLRGGGGLGLIVPGLFAVAAGYLLASRDLSAFLRHRRAQRDRGGVG